MRRTLRALLLAGLLLSACVPKGDTPTNSETPSFPGSGDYAPRPSDDGLSRGVAFVDSADLLTLESYPLQFTLSIKGSLPTPCNQLRVAVAHPDEENKIEVKVYSVIDPNTICAEVLQPFSISVSLGNFPAGHYILVLNDRQIAGFDA